jgi:hypothetical protein
MSRLDISRKYLTFRVCSRRFTHGCGFVYIYIYIYKRKEEREEKEKEKVYRVYLCGLRVIFLNCGGIGARSSDFVNFKTNAIQICKLLINRV